jgi:hypothetical protein
MFAQIFLDLRWAGLSVLLAAVMLWVGSGSVFMMFAGIFQIIVRPCLPAAVSDDTFRLVLLQQLQLCCSATCADACERDRDACLLSEPSIRPMGVICTV